MRTSSYSKGRESDYGHKQAVKEEGEQQGRKKNRCGRP